MRYQIAQVHTPTGSRADYGIEFDRNVAERIALDLNDPQQHLMGVIEPMNEAETLAERWVAA